MKVTTRNNIEVSLAIIVSTVTSAIVCYQLVTNTANGFVFDIMLWGYFIFAWFLSPLHLPDPIVVCAIIPIVHAAILLTITIPLFLGAFSKHQNIGLILARLLVLLVLLCYFVILFLPIPVSFPTM